MAGGFVLVGCQGTRWGQELGCATARGGPRPALHDLRVGAEVNLEADVIGKYVRAYLARPGSAQGLTFEKLSEAGFL